MLHNHNNLRSKIIVENQEGLFQGHNSQVDTQKSNKWTVINGCTEIGILIKRQSYFNDIIWVNLGKDSSTSMVVNLELYLVQDSDIREQ